MVRKLKDFVLKSIFYDNECNLVEIYFGKSCFYVVLEDLGSKIIMFDN